MPFAAPVTTATLPVKSKRTWFMAARRSSQMAMPCAFSSRSSASSSRMRASLSVTPCARRLFRWIASRPRISAAWRSGSARRRAREGHHLLELREQERGESRHVADRGRSGSRSMRCGANASMRSIERRKASGWNCTGVVVGMIQAPRGGVELAVGQAEGVAGEEAAARARPRCSGGASRGRACARNCSGRPASSIVMPSCVVTTRSRSTGTSVPYERSISSAP